MAGTVLERQLSRQGAARFRFEMARPEYDGVIRRLLRENPIAGEISLSFEREPNYFADLPGKITALMRPPTRLTSRKYL